MQVQLSRSSLLLALLIITPIITFAGGYLVGVQEYQKGWSDGYKAGFEEGYADGFADGNATGYAVGFAQGNSTGFAIGNKTGFKKGNETGYEQGYDEGWNIGYQEGYKDGYNAGYQDGYSKGYADGYEQGYRKGYEDGRKSVNIPGEEVNITFLVDLSIQERWNYTVWVNISGLGYKALRVIASYENDAIEVAITAGVNSTHIWLILRWEGIIAFDAISATWDEEGHSYGYVHYAAEANGGYEIVRELSEFGDPSQWYLITWIIDF